MSCIEVVASIDFDIDEMIQEVAKVYEEDIADVTMDDIYDYVMNNITYLDNRYHKGKWSVEGLCGSINGFNERSYYEIQEVLNKMQSESEE